MTKGHLEDAQIVSKHHEATPRKFHLEVMQHDSISGLRHEVEDAPAQPAWDEYEAVKRYVPYTEEELAERDKPTAEQRLDALESANNDIILMMADLIGGEA